MCSRWTEVCQQVLKHEITWDDVFKNAEIVKWLTEYEFTVHTTSDLPIDPLIRHLEQVAIYQDVYAPIRVVKSRGYLFKLGPVVKLLMTDRSRREEVSHVLGLFMYLGDQFESACKLLLEWHKDAEWRVLCLACLQSGVDLQKQMLPKHIRQQCTQAGVRIVVNRRAPRTTMVKTCSYCTGLKTKATVKEHEISSCWFRNILRK